MDKAQDAQEYAKNKDAKRFKQLQGIKKNAEEVQQRVQNPELMKKVVKEEMDNALLRMAD